MTRKHYKIIAQGIYLCVLDATEDELEVIRVVASNIAIQLKMDNPNFNRQVFLSACGLEV